MSVSQLGQCHSRCTKARELLAEVYNWFTEGFDTTDLKKPGHCSPNCSGIAAYRSAPRVGHLQWPLVLRRR
jgi:hypothetical protein